MKCLLYFGLCVFLLATIVGCEKSSEAEPKQILKEITVPVRKDDSMGAELVFSLSIDRDVYDDSDFGEPPQIAIWLESLDGSTIKTVFVTYRVGSGHWLGKVMCSAALPYWVGRYNKETGTTGPPTFRSKAPDAITGATPKQDLTAAVSVPIGSKWKYFVEVNISGDYNGSFPSMNDNGQPDPQGNGQPSLIYQGQIEAVAGAVDSPRLIGRTDQWRVIDYIIEDLESITTAKDLLSRIEVSCKK